MRPALLLAACLAPAIASAQPALGPEPLPRDRADALLRQLVPSLLSDSAATQLQRCLDAGAGLTRGALLRRILADQTGGEAGWTVYTLPNQAASEEGAMPELERSWLDSLTAVGLIGSREIEDTRLSLGVDSSEIQAFAMHPSVLSPLADVIDAIDLTRRAPLELATEDWVAAGLLTPESRDRLLSDADAGRLGMIGAVVPHLSGAAPIGETLSDPAQGPTAPDVEDLRVMLMSVSRQLEAPLSIGEIGIDSVTTVEREGTEYEWSWTVWTVTASVDGQAYRREAGALWPLSDLADLVNQVLRDRGEAARVGVALVGRLRPDVQIQPYAVLLTLRQLELAGPSLVEGHDAESEAVHALAATLPESCRDLIPDLEKRDRLWMGWEATPDMSLSPTTAEAQAFYRTLADAGVLRGHHPDTLAAAFLATFPGPSDPWQEWAFFTLPSDIGVIFDWEAATTPPDYEALTLELAALTGGDWAPEAITARVSGEHIDYGFRVAGQLYQARLEFNGDWYDPGALGVVARSVEETVSDGRLYWLGDSILFLTRDQVRVLADLPGFERLEQVTGQE